MTKSKSKSAIAEQLEIVQAKAFPNRLTSNRSEFVCNRFEDRFIVGSNLGDYKALLISDRGVFKKALKTASATIPELQLWDERIDQIVEHESRHIEATRAVLKNYKNVVAKSYYGIKFFHRRTFYEPSLSPFSTTLFKGRVPNFTPEELYAITSAPENKSPGDLSKLAKLKPLIRK